MILEERYTEIERENRILFEKMSNIVKKNYQSSVLVRKGPKSLNAGKRKKDT